MLGDRGLGHREGLGQLRDRGFPRGQPGQDRPPRGIGERREGGVEPARSDLLITIQLHN